MKNRQKKGVFAAIRAAAGEHRLLTVGTLLCVAASVAASLLPPLVLARIIDRLMGGLPLSLLAALLYSAVWRWRVSCPRRRRACWCCSGRK